MVVYGLPVCNYTNKVLIFLHFKEIRFTFRSPPGGYGTSEYKKIVPLGTIPAIQDGEIILSESEVINEYLNEIYPEPNLLPGNPEQKAFIRMLCRFHDLKLEPVVRSLFSEIDPVQRNYEKVKKQCLEMERLWKLIGGIISPTPFLAGESPTTADCAYAPTLLLAELMWNELGEKLHLGNPFEIWMDRMNSMHEVNQVLESAHLATIEWIESKKSTS